MKKKILILGVSSFAGSSFANYLINLKSKYNILGTYNSKRNLKKLIFYENRNQLNLKQLNLNSKKKYLIKLVRSFKPDYIFDFASVCMVNESWNDPNYYFNVNFNSKIDLVKNLSKFKFLKKFIYVSTPEIFGSTSRPMKETSKSFNPSTPYAVSKLVIENLLSSYQKNENSKIIITRFSNFYGRGQLDHRLVPKVLKSIKNNLKFPMHGNGMTKRDFIFDEDFNNAFLKVLKKGKVGKIYHFSSNNYVTIKKVIEIICKLKKIKFGELVVKASERKGKDKNYFLDCKKTSKQLDWKCKNNLSQGIQKTIKFYDVKL